VNTQNIDTWQSSQHHRLDTVIAALHTLIDCGPADHQPPPRKPTVEEIASQDRADGRFAPTPAGTSRRTGISRPVEQAVLAWELEIQKAVTELWELVATSHSVTSELALDLHAPPEPPTWVTANGRTLVARDPAGCRRDIQAAAAYLADVVDTVTERLRSTTHDAHDGVTARATLIGGMVKRLHTRHATPPSRQRALIYCIQHPDKLAKYRGLQLCAACRQAQRRAS
jgi:hypothetical protein